MIAGVCDPRCVYKDWVCAHVAPNLSLSFYSRLTSHPNKNIEMSSPRKEVEVMPVTEYLKALFRELERLLPTGPYK